MLGLAAGYPGVKAIEARQAAAAVRQGAVLIDLRGADAFCRRASGRRAEHRVRPEDRLLGRLGRAVPATRVVLLASNAGEAAEAGRQLLRVGLDAVEGYIDGGFEAWRRAGLPTVGD